MNMKMKKIFVILASVAGLFSVSSCASKLDVTPQNNIYDEQIQDILENGSAEKQQLVMNAIAAPMVKYFNFWGSPMPGGALAPTEYCYQGMDQARSLMGNDMVMASNRGETNSLAGTAYYEGTADWSAYDANSNWCHWVGYAYAINQANMLLGYMTKEAAEKSDLAKDGRVRGLCVRAFSYMGLMEEYCQPYTGAGKDKLGMSIYTVYDPAQAPVERSSATETWKFIIDDLKEAETLTSGKFTTGYAELEDFDNAVVNFLLARAYILTGQWSEAIAACDKIINSGKYSFIADDNYGCNPTGADLPENPDEIVFLPQNNAFTALQKNPECILGFIKTSSYNLKTQANLTCAQTRMQNPFGAYAASSIVRMDDRLYSKIADKDIRKNAFYPKSFMYKYGSNTSATEAYSYSAMKYGATCGLKDGGTAESTKDLVDENEFCKFRYSEVILMKAEAQAQDGKSEAKTTLDELIKARTAGQLTCDTYPSMQGLTPLQMVQLQYRIEMWGENGREYFNNKRWGIDVDRSGSGIHWASSFTLKASDMVLQIPRNERENNPLLILD